MHNINISCTKDKQELLNAINSSLIKLGFNFSSFGMIYFRKCLELAILDGYNEIILKNLYKSVAKEFRITENKVRININNFFNRIDIDKCMKFFSIFFNIEFDYFYITPKNIIILFCNKYNLH